MKTHWRSNIANSFVITTPANNTNMTISSFGSMNYGNVFWGAAGGAVEHDVGLGLPLFQGNIVLRGGMWGLSFYNADFLPVSIKIYIGNTVARPDASLVPGTVNIGWDPSLTADIGTDYAKFGKAYTVSIDGQQSYKLERRIRTRNVDQETWIQNGYAPTVMIAVSNLGTVSSKSITVTRYYNLSFTGDAA